MRGLGLFVLNAILIRFAVARNFIHFLSKKLAEISAHNSNPNSFACDRLFYKALCDYFLNCRAK